MRVTVTNWNNYQERQDRANYVWFKFHNNLLRDAKILALKPIEKLMFIHILTLCSEANEATVDLDAGLALLCIGVKEIDLTIVLGKIERSRLISCVPTMLRPSEMECFQEKPALVEESRREEIYRPDLDQIYQAYPRKRNTRKQFGMDRLKKQIKTPEDYALLQKAVRNFRVDMSDRPEDKIMQFGRFAGEWREYADISPRQQTLIPVGVDE